MMQMNEQRHYRAPLTLQNWRWMKTTALACAAFILVSCGESVTAPNDDIAMSQRERLLATLNADAEIISIRRVTDIATRQVSAGRAGLLNGSHREVTQEIARDRIVRRHGEEVPSAHPDAALTSHTIDVDHLPTPMLEMTVRPGMGRTRGAWTRTLSQDDGNAVEFSGVGDGPASRIIVIRGGRKAMLVTQSWVRFDKTTWHLTRQVTSSTDGSFRDVINVTRSSAAAESHLALKPFSLNLAASVRLSVSSRSLSPTSPLFDIDCTGYDGSDACADKRDAVAEQQVVYIAAALTTTAVCLIPEPLEPAACATAMIAFTAADHILELKKQALKRCLDEEAAKKRCCNAALRAPLSPETLSPAGAGAMGPGVASRDIIGAGCTDPTPGEGGNGPLEPGTGSGGYVQVCIYNVEYDTVTGEITKVWLDHCSYVWMI